MKDVNEIVNQGKHHILPGQPCFMRPRLRFTRH